MRFIAASYLLAASRVSCGTRSKFDWYLRILYLVFTWDARETRGYLEEMLNLHFVYECLVDVFTGKKYHYLED
jgi:hypothetical protein